MTLRIYLSKLRIYVLKYKLRLEWVNNCDEDDYPDEEQQKTKNRKKKEEFYYRSKSEKKENYKNWKIRKGKDICTRKGRKTEKAKEEKWHYYPPA